MPRTLTLQIHNLTFSYETGSPLFQKLNQTFSPGWTGIAGANGSGKSTLLKLIAGELSPRSGSIRRLFPDGPEDLIYLPQQLLPTPEENRAAEAYREALYEGNREAHRWQGLLGVEYDWFDRRESLSPGEARRLRLAGALWREPACLCLDEPVNHLDAQARELVGRALERYRGIGLLVSHDRHLLKELPRGILFLQPSGAVFRRGGYERAAEELRKEEAARRKAREQARKERQRLEAEASRRRALAASQQARRSKKHLAPKDADGRWRKNLARVSGKDGSGGRLLRQMDGRLDRARKQWEASPSESEGPTGITLRGERGKGDFLLRRPPEVLSLGEPSRVLRLPELALRPGEKVGLSGANGTGKSTLLRLLVREAEAADRALLFLPQEFSPREEAALREEFRSLAPRRKGEVLSALARLGSSPEGVLNSRRFSPGEARKLFLAGALCGEHPPELLILDEPENHLDLPALGFLEEALHGFPGALLLVSHDRELRQRLTEKGWEIRREEGGSRLTASPGGPG